MQHTTAEQSQQDGIATPSGLVEVKVGDGSIREAPEIGLAPSDENIRAVFLWEYLGRRRRAARTGPARPSIISTGRCVASTARDAPGLAAPADRPLDAPPSRHVTGLA